MTAQILALIIFLAMFVLIILEVWDRHLITLGCGLLTLVLVFGLGMRSMSAVWETLNVKSIFTTAFWYAAGESSEASSGINWQTIIFIAGMMIMVEGMARVGFFRWLCMRLAKLVKYQVIPIFMTFMVLSFVLAMFIDSITVILFLAAVTIELSKLLEFNPVPMILSEIFCANLGGSATMCGDPPNIIIGTSLGFTFMDFIKNTGLIAVIALVVVVIYFYFIFHKELEKNGAAKKDRPVSGPGGSHHQQRRFYRQLRDLPLCSGSSGDSRPDRTYGFHYRCLYCGSYPDRGRKRRPGTFKEDRLSDASLLYRPFRCCRRPGADWCPEDSCRYH